MADGNILAEKVKLKRAVDSLTERRNHTVCQGQPVSEPSLYAQLRSDLAGTQGDTRTPAKSLPPIWIDACMLLSKIDKQTRLWMPEPGDTPNRLQALAFKAWRPQDCDQVKDMTRTVGSWCVSIGKMLEPEAVMEITLECPACGQRYVWGPDSAGTRIRKPALMLSVKGCTCQACDAHWAPEYYMHLSRLLNIKTPEGVVHGAEDAS